MNDEKFSGVDTQYSERAQYRMRLAARFLRQSGYRFTDGNFYVAVLHSISGLGKSDCEELRSLVDWLEAYELAG